MSFRIDLELNDHQQEILIDCLYYWSMEILKRIISIIVNTTDVEKALSIRNILRKFNGCCNPVDIERTATTYNEEVEKLAECLEHNKKVLQEIAEVLRMDIDVSVDPEICIEEAIEWR